MIFFGNFQSRGPVKGGFEVDSSRHFLLFRWRDTNVYFLEDFPPGWPRFFSRGVSPDEQSFWNSWRRRRWTSRSNPKRGHLVPRVFSLTIFKSYGGCIHLNTLGGEGGGRHHERNLVVLIEHTMAPWPELEPVWARKPFVHFPSRSMRIIFVSNIIFEPFYFSFVSYRVQL